MKVIKIITLMFIGVLILNMILLALGKIRPLLFWIIIIMGGISSYFLNNMDKNYK